MKTLIAAISLILINFSVQAEELSVVDIRSNIPLSDEEPVYKDFYIAGNGVDALKKNMVITAVRKTSIRDFRGAQSYGEIEIPVGQLRVLEVFGNVAVAREYKLLSRDEHPMLEQIGIMSGDRIETKGSFIDKKVLPKAKRKTASVSHEVSSPAPPSTTVQAPTVNTSAPSLKTPAPASIPSASIEQPAPENPLAPKVEISSNSTNTPPVIAPETETFPSPVAPPQPELAAAPPAPTAP